MTRVTINRLPVDTFSYFQWFLLGLYQLQQEGKIELKFKISILDRIALLWFNNKFVAGTIRRLMNQFIKVPRYNLIGTIETEGVKKTFTIDPKDSPFVFTDELLERCDAYFKNQCPIEIRAEGFEIIPGVIIPWQDINLDENGHDIYRRKRSELVYKLRHRIHPGMVGPRRLAWSCKFKPMKAEYDNFLQSRKVEKHKTLLAYFGSSEGIKPTQDISRFDLDWEWDLMAYLKPYGSTHPNEKRAKAVALINQMNDDGYDGRIITEVIEGKTVKNSTKAVSLSDFCDFVAHFKYNLNISGFRLSIPNRFIESFISGTAIITDKLAVKWYKPFDCEVMETVRMGYLPSQDVDWSRFCDDIASLPKIESSRIIQSFEAKWSPKAFAAYILETTLKS